MDNISKFIVLDTETTGYSYHQHKIIEIGCVEIINNQITDKKYKQKINPERDIDPQAYRIHNITRDELRDCPLFSEIKEEFLEFIKDSVLVIHNSHFDINFLNKELNLCNASNVSEFVRGVIDTVQLARKKLPNLDNHKLDTLCDKFQINKSSRKFHGALIDAELLALVFLKLKDL